MVAKKATDRGLFKFNPDSEKKCEDLNGLEQYDAKEEE